MTPSLCPTCGRPAPWREAVDPATGRVVARGPMCDPCFGAALAEAAELRLQFEELLELGVNRDLANEVMVARIDGRSAARAAALAKENA